MGYDNETDQVDDEARKEKERVRNDLLRIVLGDRDLSGNGRMNRGRAVFVKDETLEKKKKKDESEQREAFKRAQEALDRQLAELHKLIAQIDARLNEIKIQKTALERLEELHKSGKLDAKNSEHVKLAREAGLTQEQLEKGDIGKIIERLSKGLNAEETELRKQREELQEKVDEIVKGNERIDNDRSLSIEEKLQKKQELLARAEVVTFYQVADGIKNNEPDNLKVSSKELAHEGLEKLKDGVEGLDEIRTAKTNSFASSGFLAASMDGDGTYTKGIGEKGLTSQVAFNSASSITQEENKRPKPETKIENIETPAVKAVTSFTG